MKRRIAVSLALAVLVVAGCAPAVSVTRLGTERYPARREHASVKVFFSKLPTCPYEEIAHLKAKVGELDAFGNSNKLVAALEKKARELGGDGILLGPISRATQEGVVIKFRLKDCRE